MKVTETALPGVLILEPRVFGDSRGYFFESYSAERYAAAGIDAAFVQDNVSCSSRGVLRGLHFQNPHGQGKLIQVLQGRVYDVAVDIRHGSPTFARWVGQELSATNGRQLYVPPGFAHGFLVLSEQALFAYKCTDYYRPDAEHTIRWDDASIGIDWPELDAVLSEKDARGLYLDDFAVERLPRFREA
jgi:dTDP-4-dehydrorhamnose 3,5-epimerase